MNLALVPSVLTADGLLATLGLAGVLGAVFAETGLLIGFFLPGDSLLFTAGLLAARPQPFAPLWVLLLTVPVAAVLGDQLGYLIGRRTGPALYSRGDSRLFRQAHVRHAQDFFDRHGARTILLARFVPVVRTFAPVVAGVAGMPYRTFVVWNVLGGILWGAGVTTAGYLLGGVPFVADHIEVILILIVVVSLVPVVVQLVSARRRSRT